MDRIALLDASYTIQTQINTLKRGLPIAEAKARTEFKRLQIRRKYTAQIKTLQEQIKAINAVIWPDKEASI